MFCYYLNIYVEKQKLFNYIIIIIIIITNTWRYTFCVNVTKKKSLCIFVPSAFKSSKASAALDKTQYFLFYSTKQNLSAGLISFLNLYVYLDLIAFCLHFINSFTHNIRQQELCLPCFATSSLLHACSRSGEPSHMSALGVRKHVLQHAFNKNIFITVNLWTHYPSPTSPPLLLIDQLWSRRGRSHPTLRHAATWPLSQAVAHHNRHNSDPVQHLAAW